MRVACPGLRHRAAACLLAACLVALSIPAAGQEDTLLVDAVVELRLLDGPDAIVPALSYNGTILLPLRRFLEMSEIGIVAFVPGDRAEAVLEPGPVRVVIVPDAGLVMRGDSIFSIPPLDARWRGNELFLATDVLDHAFGVTTVMEFATLTAQVRGTASLPVVRRARRARRRTRMAHRAAEGLPASLVGSPRGVADGAVLEWSLRGATDRPFDDYAADLGLGARLLGGSTELRQRVSRLTGTTQADTRLSWERAWTEERWIRQLRLGDVLSNGRRSRLVQGIAVTNAPFIRSSEFDFDAVMGQLPAGWEVELYDRGVLSGFQEADGVGAYRLPLELQYGRNPFDLVFYGPAGEVIREERTIRVPTSRLPAGDLEYAVAGGRCRFEPCQALISSDVRYGVSGRLTVQGGMDYFWSDAGDVWQPYAVVSGTPLPSLHATGELVLNGHLRGSLDYEPSVNLRVSASHTMFDPDGERVTPRALERHRADASVFWRPDWANRRFSFVASGSFGSGLGVSQNSQRATARWRSGWLQYETGIRHDFLARNGVSLTSATSVEAGTWANLAELGPRFQNTTGRAAVAVDLERGLASVQASVGRQIAHAVRVDLGLSWFRLGGYGLELRFNTLLNGPRMGTVSTFRSRGGAQSFTTLDGSMVVDPDTRLVQFSDGRDLGRGGVAGVVFLDDNGNGRRDPGEQGLPGVYVQIGGWPDETDARGRFAAWNVVPFEPTIIQVDTLALDDPRLVVLTPIVAVDAAPNSFVSVDLPVVIGAEVAGFLLVDGSALAGAPVELRNLRTGAVITVMTFADGGFYRVGVPPGEYEVGVPAALLDELDATVVPLTISIPTGRAADEVQWDDLVLRLTRRGNE